MHGGALLEDARTRQGHVALAGAAQNNRSGPGWTLAPGEHAGDLVLFQQP